MSKKLLYGVIFFFGMTLTLTASASTLGQTSDHSTNDLVSGVGQHTWVFVPDADQTFNRVTIWNDGTYTGSQTLRLLNSAGTIIASSTMSVSAGSNTFTFPSTNLVNGSKYAIQPYVMYLMGAPYNGASDLDPKGCKEYAYAGGALGTCGAGNTQPKADIYIQFANMASITPFITASSTIPASTIATNIGGVVSQNFPRLHTRLYGNTYAGAYYSDFYTDISATTTANVYVQLATGSYYLKYWTVDSGGVETEITNPLPYPFSVSGVTGFNAPQTYTFFAPSSTAPTSTSTSLTVDCNDSDGFFQSSFCKMFRYLFVPNQTSFDQFATLKNNISNKPPMGYFGAVQSALGGLSSTSTSAYSLATTTALNAGVFTQLRTGVSMLLWVLLAMWTLYRMRHLNL